MTKRNLSASIARTVLFVMVNLVASASRADTHDGAYIPMLGKYSSWEYTMFSPSLYHYYQELGGFTHLASEQVVYRVDETQEIDGKAYYLVSEDLPVSFGPCQRHQIVLREEGGRVIADYEDYRQFLESYEDFKVGDSSYIPYPKTDGGELILYDFSLQEGDRYAAEVDGHPEVIVENVDSVIDNQGRERRRLTLSNGCVIIEGIGCINSRGMLLSYLNPHEATGDYIFWLFWKVDEDVVFHQNVDESTLGIADSLVLSHAETNGFGYTLNGIRMTQPKRGIIIKDGKKKLAR